MHRGYARTPTSTIIAEPCLILSSAKRNFVTRRAALEPDLSTTAKVTAQFRLLMIDHCLTKCSEFRELVSSESTSRGFARTPTSSTIAEQQSTVEVSLQGHVLSSEMEASAADSTKQTSKQVWLPREQASVGIFLSSCVPTSKIKASAANSTSKNPVAGAVARGTKSHSN